ncbi:unnamed protein product [Oikopleura dioica]|uniref:Uncharacterized protein n=1 Tax=Oikopleura dioica TaxID=34765 RepID=E4WW67_OIKDI|nr:unnamed protein product [Oikopleura dioica]
MVGLKNSHERKNVKNIATQLLILHHFFHDCVFTDISPLYLALILILIHLTVPPLHQTGSSQNPVYFPFE